MAKPYYLPLCLAALLISSCGKDARSIEQIEENDPQIKAGQAFMESKDWGQAIHAFKQALENNPRLARPHLDLAQIYQQYKINYIHAIYHYDRYLELRPETEKASMINEQRELLAKALATTFINNSDDVKRVVLELKRLQKENEELKKKLASGGSPKAAVAKKTAVTQSTKPKSKPASAKPAPKKEAHQIYHVVAGDSLSKIASRFYKDPGKWDIIYNANKDRMKSSGDLRVGQTLVIPAL